MKGNEIMSRKIRKIAAGICALAMTASVFSACGDKNAQSGAENGSEAVFMEVSIAPQAMALT